MPILANHSTKASETYSFSMGGKLVRVPLLVFWPESNLQIFTKVLRNPIALLRRINTRIVIIFNDMLELAQAAKEIVQ